MVVNGYGQHLLGALLADHILVQQLGDAARLGYLAAQVELSPGRALYLFVQYLSAKLDALVTDVDGSRPRYEAADVFLGLATKRATILGLTAARVCHASPSELEIRS